ncbi:MAG TPA: hydrogenase iron-sulfur subunit [Deltaproteobacteria bacterium]|nr:hydrogenase iron-sulfur subunit [Deltaproteobacteria bacterium]
MGDCHYLYGIYATDKRVRFLRGLLAFSGIGEERLRSRWISSAEGPEFAQEIRDFIEALRELGPSPLREKEEMLRAA